MRCNLGFLTVLATMAATAVSAQNLRDIRGPAETPPASYSALQYVDSRGCVFVRAGYAGQVTWVPRVSRDGKVICGQEPAKVAAAAPAEAPAASPAPASPERAAPVRTARKTASRPADRSAGAAAQPPVTAEGGVALVSVETISSALTACVGKSVTAERYRLSDGRTVLRCGAPVADPVAYLNRLDVAGLQVSGAAPAKAAASKVARNTPVLSEQDRAALPRGYRPAWDDDRLNENRGEPSGRAVAAARQQPAAAATLPARRAMAGGFFVQVGAFTVATNADGAVRRVEGLDLPAARQASRIGGRAAEIVLAGPFASRAEAAAGAKALRRAGFADAFVR